MSEPSSPDPGVEIGTSSGTRRRGPRTRRVAAATVLVAGLAAAGLAGGHALGAVVTHGAVEHGRYEGHAHGDDGVVFAPLPGPVAPPVPGR